MKNQHSDTTHAAAAVTGDERLTLELAAILDAHGIEVIDGGDAHALKAAAPRLAAAFELTVLSSDEKKERIAFLDAHTPASVPVISSSVTVTALAQSQWMTHPERLIGFSGFPTLLGAPLIDIATTHRASDESLRLAREFFALLGKETVCVQDRTGMIVPAMVSQIVNEALMVVQQNVASARDIDTAMKLGAGYPLGPIEWGEKIGFAYILSVLEAMRLETGEARFRTSPLLRQLAIAGRFWHEPVEAPAAVQEQLALGGDAAPEAEAEGTKKKRTKKRAAGV